MTRVIDDVIGTAERAWTQAAAAAGVEIAPLVEWDHIERAAALLAAIWDRAVDDPPLNTDLLRALTHSGNYAAIATNGDEIVAAIVGFHGRHGDVAHLHSHILGVAPSMRSRSVGFAMKQHQRHWCLERGIRTVAWTFDPLVRRNAYFNICRLGADADAYLPNFYGSMKDGINRDDESDRLFVRWQLDSPTAVVAAVDRIEPPTFEDLVQAGANTWLTTDATGRPTELAAEGRLLLCGVPEDIVGLRTTDPDRSARWRAALRDTLGAGLADGYRVSHFLRSGWYVLER